MCEICCGTLRVVFFFFFFFFKNQGQAPESESMRSKLAAMMSSANNRQLIQHQCYSSHKRRHWTPLNTLYGLNMYREKVTLKHTHFHIFILILQLFCIQLF